MKKKKKGIYRVKPGPCVSVFTYLIPGTSHDLGLDARDWTCDRSTNTTVTYLNHIITVQHWKLSVRSEFLIIDKETFF